MTDKLDLYDILGSLVPGVLFVWWLSLCFPGASATMAAKGPEAFIVITLTSLAFFIGQVIQALGSLLEPLLFRTWGGRPSEQVLSKSHPTNSVPADAVDRIKRKLQKAVGKDA